MSGGPVDNAVRDTMTRRAIFAIERQRYPLPLVMLERVVPMVAVAALPQAPDVALGVWRATIWA